MTYIFNIKYILYNVSLLYYPIILSYYTTLLYYPIIEYIIHYITCPYCTIDYCTIHYLVYPLYYDIVYIPHYILYVAMMHAVYKI
jgi:hypothetical protein